MNSFLRVGLLAALLRSFVVPLARSADVETNAAWLEDQRFAASRTDVLVYETEPLEEDLTLAGPLRATFHVSTTGTDSDWVIKLIDVYPGDYPNPVPNPANVKLGGAQQLVRGDVFRGKFRNSFEKPEPFTPGRRRKSPSTSRTCATPSGAVTA